MIIYSESLIKEGCVFLMVIWSEFDMAKYRDHDHREDAPHFIRNHPNKIEFKFRIRISHITGSDTSLLMCNCEKRIIKNRKFEC